ncbi:MAG: hypothetical protein IPN20_25205 [Haliscomenobacter sp.]|nr:hypothetical protein [Haliscomenobacter sp.]
MTGMTVGIIYPFMGGAYDRLAMPLSALLQGIGIIGLVFPVLGILWLVVPDKSRLFATITLSFASFLTLVFAFMAYLIAGIFLGIIVLVFLAGSIGSLRQRLKNRKTTNWVRLSLLT